MLEFKPIALSDKNIFVEMLAADEPKSSEPDLHQLVHVAM